ncbi:hypothetical protein [Candidatus Chlorohelix sp.]|uniref:hypothetical protein n=1 Tax=Candidatus Chlorohelix sp. TaxID=3139201 RepID=UPI003048BB19
MNDYKEWLESGRKSLESGRIGEARRLFTGAVQANPSGEEGWLYLAATLPPRQAYQALQRVLEINPANPQALRGIEALKMQLESKPADPVDSLFSELGVDDSKSKKRAIRLASDSDLSFGVQESEDMRKLLTQPYLDEKLQPRQRKPGFTALLGALLLVLIITAVILYMSNIGKPGSVGAIRTDITSNVETTTAIHTTDLASAETTEARTTIPPTPVPTVSPFLNLKLVQNERGQLTGVNLTFSSYDNRSTNFSLEGAGTPSPGKHFEGVWLLLENTYNQPLGTNLELYQGIDSRNRFLTPVQNGRVPALDLKRLLPGESRLFWLTFEMEDGTSLRRVVYTPQGLPDEGNSLEVNLFLPSATPTPTIKPTNTALPKPTTTLLPTTANTPLPPTFTPVLAATETVMIALSTPTPEATSTRIALPTAIALTATPMPIALPSPTPLTSVAFNQRYLLGNFALIVNQYQPSISAKPSIIPTGYHYESVKITLENTGSSDVSDFVKNYPFYLRDSNGQVYTTGPYTLEAKDRFDPFQFETATKGAGKDKVSGILYYLVSDTAKSLPRTLVFYASNDKPELVAEFALK